MTIHDRVDANTYTDFQGLNSIKRHIKNNPELAKKEISKQFESLMMQMLLKSMRDGTRAISEESNDDDHKAIYEDLFDKQLSLSMSNTGVGLSELIEKSLTQAESMDQANSEKSLEISDKKTQELQAPTQVKKSSHFPSPENFISSLWSLAKKAATFLGADPKVMMAQAALETSWGKNILSHLTGQSSHNLFNIKADNNWDKDTVAVKAKEIENGLETNKKSNFRSYESFEESFRDYVHFLQNNPRYKNALKHAAEPEKFVSALQKANFATDPGYADKIMQIYHSKAFNNAF